MLNSRFPVLASLSALQIVGGVILLLACLALIFIVLFQSGHNAGLGSIDGGADTFLGRNKARSVDALLARITKWVAIVFGVVVLLLNIL